MIGLNKVKGVLYALLFAGFATVLLYSCRMSEKPKPIISVTIQPQKYFAEKLVGDRFIINCVVPQGGNPEAYDPTPSHLVQVGKSVAYWRIGSLGFELAWLDKLAQNNPDMRIFDLSKGVEPLPDTHHHSSELGRHLHASDPHYWSSPKKVLIMVRNMYDAVLELDPKGEKYYTKNYEELVAEISRVDSVLEERLEPVHGQMFAIYHPSLSYLASDYHLRQLSVEHNGKEASAFSLKKTVDVAKENGVRVIFIQREFDAKLAEVFAKEIGAKIVPINPLNYNWSEEIIAIADALVE